MQKDGIKRLIATVTPSARDPEDSHDVRTAWQFFLIKATMKSAYNGIVKTAEAILNCFHVVKYCKSYLLYLILLARKCLILKRII